MIKHKTIAAFRDSANGLMGQPDLISGRDFAEVRQEAFGESTDSYMSYEELIALVNARHSDSDKRMFEQFYALAEEALLL